MKSSKTMRELAKALALRKGLRVPDKGKGGYVGYALTISAIKELYLREGFPINSKRGVKTLEKHIDMWTMSHMATRQGDLIFFALDPDSYLEDDARKSVREYMDEYLKARDGRNEPTIYDVSEMLYGLGLEA